MAVEFYGCADGCRPGMRKGEKNVYSHRLLLRGSGGAAVMALRAACSGITNKRPYTLIR